MSDRKGWRTVRVVVELPVQGDYTDRDLVWDVRWCLDERMTQVFRRRSPRAKLGMHRIKEYGRYTRARVT